MGTIRIKNIENTLKCNQYQYKMLLRCSENKDISEWNEWRVNNPDEEIYLNTAKLGNAYLEGANLAGAQMQGAHLYDSNLKNANLRHTNLEDSILFQASLKGADITKAILKNSDLRWANLRNAKLNGTILVQAQLEFSHLDETHLYYANLNGAILEKAYMREARLIGTHLVGTNLHEANLEGANLHEAHLEGADIHHAEFNNANLRNIWIDKNTRCEESLFGNTLLSIDPICNISEKEVINILSEAEINNVRFIDPVLGRKVRDEAWLRHYKKSCNWYKRPLLFIWAITSDYGRNIWLWIMWSIFFALCFGFQFYSMGPNAFKVIYLEHSLETMFYYSIVTFTTLGFGDVIPRTAEASYWVMAEVILGYLMLGGLISIFANKFARRND